MDTCTLRVDLGSRSYDILVGDGILDMVGEHIAPLLPIPNVIMITDEQVAPYYLDRLTQSLAKQHITSHAIVLKVGERSKSFGALEWLIDRIFECKPERNTTLIALGGGVVGDVTGFAASIILRGIPFIQIPTTLLAQVDSAVGGKTGINHTAGKNLIGSFYQPLRVISDVSVLRTLSTRHFLAGYAEVVKYGLINDAAFFDWLGTHKAEVLAQDKKTLQHMVVTSCQAKAAIVASDEKEQNVRALLNLGHTFGHALEAVTKYKDVLLHGEGVAIGMVMAADLSVRLGLCEPDACDQIKTHLQAMGLPVSLAEVPGVKWDVDQIMLAMQQDKKTQHGELVFVVMEAIGKASLKRSVAMAMVKDVVQHARGI